MSSKQVKCFRLTSGKAEGASVGMKHVGNFQRKCAAESGEVAADKVPMLCR